MNKNILKKKNAENAAIATGVVAVGLLASGPMKAEADGSSSAGSGGGSNSGNDRQQSSGYSGSASRAGSGSYSGSGSGSSGGYSGSGGGSETAKGFGGTAVGYNSTGQYAGQTNASQAGFEAAAREAAAARGTSVSISSGAGYSNASFGDGSSASWSGNGGGGSSTPFLTTWNGKKYEFENDFLFGKPITAFNNYAEGLSAYKAGIGGDTYFLKNKIKSENGILKFQIKEIEPEESFIDSFALTAVDLPKNTHPVVDGNLKDTYIFDATKTKAISNQSASILSTKTKVLVPLKNTTPDFRVLDADNDTTLRTGDVVTIKLPVDESIKDDVFLMVDSYFRDWTLGNQVPFTTSEKIIINTITVIKNAPVLIVALVLGVFGMMTKPSNADVPRYSQNGYTGGGGGGGFTGGGTYTGYRGGSRSLVVSLKIGNEITYLQTIFPRYVQASQEVVRIPTELIKKAIGSTLEVCIEATKKHKVRSLYLFTGTSSDKNVVYTPLTITSAVKQSTATDYSDSLNKKDGNFLRTIPGDVVNLTVKDVEEREGYNRHYMLKANGFYTKLSTQTKNQLGDAWYHRLDSSSKKLLRNLRVYKA